ncbi:MAG: hypothetical protein JW384_04300 [Nitrosomonadaceae bacterium]|nr:hypothetical protein [Nitrosomonadaceae bacterium]
MALTYAQLSTAIQDYCESTETSFVSNISVFVQQAEDRINKSILLPVYIKNVSGNLTASNRFLSSPSDFLAQLSLTIIVNGAYTTLNEVDASFLREAYPNNSVTGVPVCYSLFNNDSFFVGPVPDSSYAVNLEYYYSPESIVTAGTSWLGDNADSCLLYGCLVEAYTYLKGEPDRLAMYDAKYKEALSRLKTLGEGWSTRDSFRGDQRVPVS